MLCSERRVLGEEIDGMGVIFKRAGNALDLW